MIDKVLEDGFLLAEIEHSQDHSQDDRVMILLSLLNHKLQMLRMVKELEDYDEKFKIKRIRES